MAGSIKRSSAELSMVVVSFIWGAVFVVTKDALRDIGPFMFLTLRFTLAFILLVTMAWKSIQTIRFSTVWYGALLGLFLFIGYSGQTVGLKYTTASNAAFITGTSVVLVPILYALINRKIPELRTFLTVAGALAGLFLMSFPDNNLSLSRGDILVFIGAFGFALHIILVDRYSHQHNAVAITSIQIIFVGIVSLIIGSMVEPWPTRLSMTVASAVLITSLFATSLAFLLMNALQKYSTPTRFAIVLTSEPVFAAIAAYLWTGETLTSRAYIGAAIILLSMLISVITRKHREPAVQSLG
ncbi:MAG: DMT family transporter [Syntrophomonadaceae bacterium]|nr:DMT family transporter [Syntrophomonadaceae bacterium]